jgi:CRISPR-associated endonuclease/helicase Cas3
MVSTQCIEVGADFSFDALLTEAASLDALRQRFGRLNRFGRSQSASATILIRDEDAKEGADDFVYGTAMSECWRMLLEKAETQPDGKSERKLLDFGIASLDARLQEIDDLAPYLAPALNAPLLLPSHIDLLCQTSPRPQVEPAVQFFLHGTDRGMPEVRVIWRADLEVSNINKWPEITALCPPNSVESVAVPLYRLTRWLAAKWTSSRTRTMKAPLMSSPFKWRNKAGSLVCTDGTTHAFVRTLLNTPQ